MRHNSFFVGENMKNYDVCLLPGDGIGPEVVAEARKVADRAGEKYGFSLKWKTFPYGAEYYLKNKVALPATAFTEFGDFDAMLLGAVGDPRVKPGPLEQGILLALRFHFDQYVNLRPASAFPGVPLPVPLGQGDVLDAVVVRENTEDLYMGLGGKGNGTYSTPLSAQRGLYGLEGKVDLKLAPEVESAFSIGLMTRPGIERITRYAFKLAASRNEKTVHVVSKANAVPNLYGFWDDVSRSVAEKEFPNIAYASVNVDAMCYLLARKPTGWGVILCPNLFGDIVSDLFSALAGGLGLAAAGNIGDRLSMFEPVHGSAPTIVNTGKANPLAAILSAGLMLRHLGETEAAQGVENAVKKYLASGKAKPCELGGVAVTGEVGTAVSSFV